MTLEKMNNLREELQKGPMLGFGIMWPQVGMIERIGGDWDWFWIDSQHGQLDYRDVLAAVRACNLVGRPAVVRVPGHEPGPIGKMLDTACEAVMVPMVETAQEAQALVRAAVKVFAFSASEIIATAARKGAFYVEEGDTLTMILSGVRRFTKYDATGLLAAKKLLAEAACEDEKYLFS